MKFAVEQFAFNNGEIRWVEVPDEFLKDHSLDETLTVIYNYGQNGMQPQQKPSVSVGDVINIKNSEGELDKHMVVGWGFEKLDEDERWQLACMENQAKVEGKRVKDYVAEQYAEGNEKLEWLFRILT